MTYCVRCGTKGHKPIACPQVNTPVAFGRNSSFMEKRMERKLQVAR